MNKNRTIETAFYNKKPLIVYLMAGDPTIEKSGEYILAAQEAGADLIEIGIPFSDPIAEGEVIQKASERALAGNATLEKIFDMLESIQDQIRIPLAFMTYINPVFVYGYDRFFTRSKACGISGLIIPDLPYEEQAEVKTASAGYNISIISLIAPTSESRIADIASHSEGFIYLVSSMGVTGMRSSITTDLPSIIRGIRQHTSLPIAVGFGISTKEQAAHYASISDGAIVGSAFVRLIGEYGEQAAPYLTKAISEMKAEILSCEKTGV